MSDSPNRVRSSSAPDMADQADQGGGGGGGDSNGNGRGSPGAARRQLQQPSLGIAGTGRTHSFESSPTAAVSSPAAAAASFGTPPRGTRAATLALSSAPATPRLGGGGVSAGGGSSGVTSTTFGSVATHHQRPITPTAYDSDDDAYVAPPVERSGSGAGRQQGNFDLCSTLYKRRGGFGRNAEINWVKRCFTLHGPILCYYDTPTISKSDPSRPRGRLNLQREDTRAEMNTKYGTSSPTEFQVTLNLYVLGSKRKWELCCADQGEQKHWYEALKVYDGKPEGTDEDGGGIPGRGSASGGGDGNFGRSRAAPSPANGSVALTPGRGGSKKSRAIREAQQVPMPATASTDDENSVDVAADYGTFPPTARESTAVVRRQPSPPRRSTPANGFSFLDHNVIVSFIALNVAVFFARNGNEQTFYLAVFMVNLVFYYMLDHLNKREEVRRLRYAGSVGRPVRVRQRTISSGGSAEMPSPVAEEVPRSKRTQPSVAKRLAAGSTLPRATVRPSAPLSELVQKHGPTSAEALRAYASSTSDDYDEIRHGYWNVAAPTFNLRIGPNYKKHGKKAPSPPALYDLYAMDIVMDDTIMKSSAEVFELPDIKGVTDVGTGCEDVPPMFVVTVNLPTEEPSMFGGETDGQSCIVVLFFVITENTLKELQDLDNASPGVKLLVEFCRKGGTDEAFRSRFKALAIVEDIEKLGLPSFITGYNGKPALITKSGSFARHSNYIEMTVNVHRWGFLPKKGLYMLKDEFPRFNVNIGFTIEGRKDYELPEVLLGGVRLMHFDLGKVGFIPGSGVDEDDIVLSGDSWD